MEREQVGGLLGRLFPNMEADRADRIRMGINGMLHNPNQGVQQAVQGRMDDRREARKTQQAMNKTLEFFKGRPNSELYAGAIAAGANASQVLNSYVRAQESLSDPSVQSSEMLPDQSGTVLTMRDGSLKVVTAGGDTLTGQDAMDFVRNSQETAVGYERDKYSARRTGTLEADIDLGAEAERVKTEGGMAPETARDFGNNAALIRSSITNMNDAIAAIDRGANSGVVYKMLPAISEASASLRNSMNRMGLDVIGSVTFGALSEGEMRLAMETAVPQNLGPADLREWLVRKQEAQRKAYQAALEAAQHFASGGTQADYYKMIGVDQPGSPPPAPESLSNEADGGLTDDDLRYLGVTQ